MANGFTSVIDADSIGVQTVLNAYDMALNWELRSQPLFRNAATVKKRPEDLNNPGPLVRFTMNPYLGAAANTDLHEYNQPTARVLPQASYIDVPLTEFGDIVIPTFKLRTVSFTDVDAVVARDLSAAMADDVDTRVLTVLRNGTNRTTSNAGVHDTTPQAVNTLTNADKFSSELARYVSTKLRAGNAIPLGDTGEYVAIIHPDTEYDMRNEVGAGNWRVVHEYQAAGNIWRGNIGIYEGLAYVVSNRAYKANDGATSQTVYRTIVMGAEALAEAVAVEPHMTIGPVTDAFNRHRPAGYHAYAGWGRFREACLWRVEHGSTINA